MDTILIILSIILVYTLMEILTWMVRKDTTFAFAYMTTIRYFVLFISLLITYMADTNQTNTEVLQESNSFKYELILHQDTLIGYYRDMINDMSDHLWKEHNCDVPQFDTDLYYQIQEQSAIIDSLYNTQN